MIARLKQLNFLLVLGLVLVVAGCESTQKNVHELDAWMKEHMW